MQDIIMLGLNARSKRLNAMFANGLKMMALAMVTYRLESYTWRHGTNWQWTASDPGPSKSAELDHKRKRMNSTH